MRINFAPPSAAVPAGYRQDTGAGFDPALRYGWSSAVSTRERVTPRPLELDTFAFSQAERRFNAEVRNGDYDLRVACGDPSNPQGPHRIRANGVSVVGDLSTARDQFVDTTVRVPVRNGRLDLIVGGTAGNTLLNLLEAGAVPGRPAVLRSINFQPAGSPRPDGWETDTGLIFDGARGYGWSASTQVRERALAFPQVLDTLAFTSGARTWELALPNGQYTVFVGAGDAAFAQGPQRIAVEGSVLIHDESTAAGVFLERQTTVSVTDGRLTLSLGGALGNTCINYVTIQSAAPPVAPAGARVEPRPRGMR